MNGREGGDGVLDCERDGRPGAEDLGESDAGLSSHLGLYVQY